LLGHPVRSVLDVGCGEARWRAPLRRLRPRAAYIGVDSSPYVVERWGRTRNIRLGSLGTLERCGIDSPADLVVCADVLHYVPAAELRRGLQSLAALTAGIAFLPTFTSADAIIGDRQGFKRRAPSVYRKIFGEAGLFACGLHFYVTGDRADELAALERC
ncbi:MAG: class I SAM-dependent methyltransferase, partial [Gemmatimonadota bacterium]|nr:class I SAM-dependent methyltransferase [Gemmatimonadota bacterium]